MGTARHYDRSAGGAARSFGAPLTTAKLNTSSSGGRTGGWWWESQAASQPPSQPASRGVLLIEKRAYVFRAQVFIRSFSSAAAALKCPTHFLCCSHRSPLLSLSGGVAVGWLSQRGCFIIGGSATTGQGVGYSADR